MPWIAAVSRHGLPDEIAERTFEAVAGDPLQLREEVQVMRRRHDRDMAHVHGQLRQIRLHVGSFEIPSDERANRKAVPEIMNTGTPAFAVLDACRFEQGLESAADASASVGTKTALRVDEKRRVGILAERWSETGTCQRQ